MRKMRLPSRLLRNSFFSLYHKAPSQPQDLLDPVAVACALFPRSPPIAQSAQGTESENSRNKTHTSVSVHPRVAELCSRSTAYAEVVNSHDDSEQFNLTTSHSNRSDDQTTGVSCALFERTERTSTIISRKALQGTCTYLDRTSNVSTTCTAAASTSLLECSRTSVGTDRDRPQLCFDGSRHVDSSLCDHLGGSAHKYTPASLASASAAAAGGIDTDNAKRGKLHAHTVPIMPQCAHSKVQLEKMLAIPSGLTSACLRDELWQRLASRAAVLLPCFSPTGLLQLLALFHHAGAVPQSLLERVARYLLEGEPYAPPTESLWRVWMANDLVLLCRLLSMCSYRHEPLLQKIMLELRRKRHLLLVSDIAVSFHAVHRLLRAPPLHLSGATVTNLRHAPDTSSAIQPTAAAKSVDADSGLRYSWTSHQQPSPQQQTSQQGPVQRRHTSRHREQHLLQVQSQRHQTQERRTHCEQEPVLVEQHQNVNLQGAEPRKLDPRHNAEQPLMQPPEQQHCRQHMQPLSPGLNDQRRETPEAQSGAANEKRVTRHITCSGNVMSVKTSFFGAEELHCFSRCAVIQLQRDSRTSLRDSVGLVVGTLRLARELQVTPPFELLASCVEHVKRSCCYISAAAVSARLLQRAIFAVVDVERLALLRLKMSFSPELDAACAPLATEQTAGLFASDAAAATVDESDEEQVLLVMETARRSLQHLFAALSTRLDEIGPLGSLDVLDALRLLKIEEEAAIEKILRSTSFSLAPAFQKESNQKNSEYMHHQKLADLLNRPSSADKVYVFQQQQLSPLSEVSQSAKEPPYLQKSEEVRRNSNFLPPALDEESRTEVPTKQQQHQTMEQREPASHCGSSFVSWTPPDHCLFELPASGPSAAALVSSDKQARANDLQQPLQPAATAAQLAEGPDWAKRIAEQKGHAGRQKYVVAAGLKRITGTDAVTFDILEGLLFHIGRSLHLLPGSHTVTFAAILKGLTYTRHLPPLGSLSNACSHSDNKDMQVASSWSSRVSPSLADSASPAVAFLKDHTLCSTTVQLGSFSTDVGVDGIANPITSAADVSRDAVTTAMKQERHCRVSLNERLKQETSAPAEEDGRVTLSRHTSEVVEVLREILLEHVERHPRCWTQTELQQLHRLLR